MVSPVARVIADVNSILCKISYFIVETIGKQHDAMQKAVNLADRNRQLEKELLEVDHMALTVESDCNTTVKRHSEKLLSLQGHLNSAQSRINELESQLNIYKQGYDEHTTNKRLIESLLDEKNRLGEKVNKFNIIGKLKTATTVPSCLTTVRSIQ